MHALRSEYHLHGIINVWKAGEGQGTVMPVAPLNGKLCVYLWYYSYIMRVHLQLNQTFQMQQHSAFSPGTWLLTYKGKQHSVAYSSSCHYWYCSEPNGWYWKNKLMNWETCARTHGKKCWDSKRWSSVTAEHSSHVWNLNCPARPSGKSHFKQNGRI